MALKGIFHTSGHKKKNPHTHTFPLPKNQHTIASRDPTGLGVGEEKKCLFLSPLADGTFIHFGQMPNKNKNANFKGIQNMTLQ